MDTIAQLIKLNNNEKNDEIYELILKLRNDILFYIGSCEVLLINDNNLVELKEKIHVLKGFCRNKKLDSLYNKIRFENNFKKISDTYIKMKNEIIHQYTLFFPKYL